MTCLNLAKGQGKFSEEMDWEQKNAF